MNFIIQSYHKLVGRKKKKWRQNGVMGSESPTSSSFDRS